MKRDSLTCLILALAAVWLPLDAAAEHRGGVTVYAAGDFRGASETFYDDVPNMKRTRVGNDHASSVRVAPGCSVILYAGGDYRGRSMLLERDLRSLSGTEVGNDAVSSLRVRCDRSPVGDEDSIRGVALYRDGGFSGRREIFYQDDSDLRNNRIGCTASSVAVASGCRATLYSEPGYRGRSVELGNDVRNLGETRLGNDVAASIRVRCDGRRDDRRDDRWDDHSDDRHDDRRDSGGGGGWNPWGGRSDRNDRGGGGVTLYAGGDFSGRSETFYGDVDRLHGTEVGNDTVSSVRIDPGCRLELFEHPDYQGNSNVLTGDVPDMRRTSLGNDRASSLRLDCGRGGGYRDDRGGGVTLYQGGDFGGCSATFFRDVRNLSETPVGNDHASSVRVSRGCRVVLYRHSDFRGESVVLTRDAENLTYTAVGNDEVSSIEVDCGR